MIWLKSCPRLCEDNHGVVASIQLCGSGSLRQWANTETQCMAGPQLGLRLQMETKDKGKYRDLCLHIKDARLLPRKVTLQVDRHRERRGCEKAYSLSVGGSLAVGDLAWSDSPKLA